MKTATLIVHDIKNPVASAAATLARVMTQRQSGDVVAAEKNLIAALAAQYESCEDDDTLGLEIANALHAVHALMKKQ